ncbi:ubiquitin-associated protein 1-like isoform X2 [Lineus longissimus]|uniref:ubiquitin-associated protein 1-like isoform X2 n=1 Tax=Lineus longissimus TaxID=88925 RepID=UPI00315D1C6C
MSYREAYREYGQLSTGGPSSLDGVPIVIAEKYRPPARVLLSSAAFEPRHVCDVLEDEYDFNLEAAVLEKYASMVEAEAAEDRAKVEQIGSTIEDFSRAMTLENTANLNESDEFDGSAGVPHSLPSEPTHAEQGTSYENNSSSFARQDNLNPAVTDQNASKAFVLPFSSTILQPTPIIPARRATPKQETKAFRIRDFETVEDPFDDLELEVLDDMAELGKVLQVAQTQHTKSPVEDTSATSPSLVNGDEPPTSATQAAPDIQPSPEPGGNVTRQRRISPQPEINTAGQSVSFSLNNANAEPPPTHGSHVIQGQQPSSFSGEHVNDKTSRLSNDGIKHGAVTNVSARTDRYSLPNISANVVLHRGIGSKGNPLPPIGSAGGLPKIPDRNIQNGPMYSQDSNLDNFAKYSSFDRDSIPTIATRNNLNPYVRHSIAATEDLLPSVKDPSHIMAQSFNASCSYGLTGPNCEYHKEDYSTRPLSGLRSARSTPDISKLDDGSKASYLLSHSPPPRPSNQQTWNRYSPLPPSTNMRNSVSDTSRGSTPTSSESPTASLPDPFARLSREEQQFTMSITDMGFPRAQVARAVQKLGADGKQVVDHLCQVTRLAENGFSTEDAETSLLLFDNDLEKAQNYLELQSQFQELGFDHEKVREALVMHDNNRDKALDYLTA